MRPRPTFSMTVSAVVLEKLARENLGGLRPKQERAIHRRLDLVGCNQLQGVADRAPEHRAIAPTGRLDASLDIRRRHGRSRTVVDQH